MKDFQSFSCLPFSHWPIFHFLLSAYSQPLIRYGYWIVKNFYFFLHLFTSLNEHFLPSSSCLNLLSRSTFPLTFEWQLQTSLIDSLRWRKSQINSKCYGYLMIVVFDVLSIDLTLMMECFSCLIAIIALLFSVINLKLFFLTSFYQLSKK